MKKILFTLAAATITLAACTSKPTITECETGTIIVDGYNLSNYYRIREITLVRDTGLETHEYLYYQCGHAAGLSHWEGCKYCKVH